MDRKVFDRRGKDVTWRGRKLLLAIDRAGLTRGGLATLLDKSGMQVARQSVYDWCRTGQIGNEWFPVLSQLLGVKVNYFLEPDAEYESVLQEEDVSPEESNLVLAFRDLLPEQQAEFLRQVRAEADKNRAVAERFARRYGRSVPDAAVAEHIQPAPKAKRTARRK